MKLFKQIFTFVVASLSIGVQAQAEEAPQPQPTALDPKVEAQMKLSFLQRLTDKHLLEQTQSDPDTGTTQYKINKSILEKLKADTQSGDAEAATTLEQLKALAGPGVNIDQIKGIQMHNGSQDI